MALWPTTSYRAAPVLSSSSCSIYDCSNGASTSAYTVQPNGSNYAGDGHQRADIDGDGDRLGILKLMLSLAFLYGDPQLP